MPVIYSLDCTVSLYAMDWDPYFHLVREQYEVCHQQCEASACYTYGP